MEALSFLVGPFVVVAALAAYVALLFSGWLPRGLWVVPWPFWIAAAAGVALALRAALRTRRTAAWLGLAVAGLLAVAFVAGVPVATRLPAVAAGPVAPGAAAPDFTLPSTGGGEVTLSSLRGREVVLVFHRGHW